VVTICAIVVFPHNPPFLIIELNICKALMYSVHDPLEEVLYSQVQGQVLVDVVGQRVAKLWAMQLTIRLKAT
jgi:hypothetical protein